MLNPHVGPAATIRSQSLGISVGTGLSIENALGVFKPDGDPAWDAIDFAVFAARRCAAGD